MTIQYFKPTSVLKEAFKQY